MDRQGGLEVIELAMSRAGVGETVSRAVSKLRKGGHIRLDGARSIKILRPEAIRGLCG
jgi:CRP/FNR family nitrogen fixation transcriptional regulator